jgi:hypothetical protein
MRGQRFECILTQQRENKNRAAEIDRRRAAAGRLVYENV